MGGFIAGQERLLPVVHVSSVNSLDSDEGADRVQYDNARSLEHVELSYKNAAVLIKYSPLDYIFPKGYKYAYRMEGLDQNWNYIERNEVIYSHLPAGEYTFYIKACNSDGIWGDATGIDVVVHPPVWLTGWAKVIYVLLALMLVGGVLYYFYKRKSDKYQRRIEEIEKENIEDKLGIIDLKATINKETTVDIEIQVRDYHNMIERSTFYIAGLYHTGLKRGEAYEENNKVIGINILMFNVFEWKKIHSKGVLKESELNEVMTDKLELHFLELPKLIENKEEGNKRLRQWLEFIYNKRKGEIEMAVKENEKIAKAQVEYKYLTGDEKVQRLAFLRDKWESDHKSELNWEKREAEKRGEKRGEIRGKKLGEEMGRLQEKRQIVIKMLKENYEDEIIIKITDINKEELEKLKKENWKN